MLRASVCPAIHLLDPYSPDGCDTRRGRVTTSNPKIQHTTANKLSRRPLFTLNAIPRTLSQNLCHMLTPTRPRLSQVLAFHSGQAQNTSRTTVVAALPRRYVLDTDSVPGRPPNFELSRSNHDAQTPKNILHGAACRGLSPSPLFLYRAAARAICDLTRRTLSSVSLLISEAPAAPRPRSRPWMPLHTVHSSTHLPGSSACRSLRGPATRIHVDAELEYRSQF